LAEHADKHGFTVRPWETYGLTDEQLIAHVQSAIAAHGYWSAYGELAMGGGMQVRIEAMKINGQELFRATGGDLITITADYRSLDRALDMVALFGRRRIGWDMTVSTSWRDADLVIPEPRALG